MQVPDEGRPKERQMAGEELELFIHRQGEKSKLAVARPHEVLRDVLVRMEVIQEGADEVMVFVGEWDEVLREPDEVEDGEDQHEPVNVLLTIEALELHRHRHVHVHKCKRVAVDVNFTGGTKRHRFSPATTIGVVTQWARKKFKLDGAAGAEYVLQLCKSTKQPRSGEHLGELVEPPTCAICFDLVKEITPQG
jgi:hypothetical protein